MVEIVKPSGLNTRWAQGGDILDPGLTKYAQGWEVEIPPRQWFNFLDNRQDEALAHINQHGIAVWDAETEYQASKSYVQGSNGSIYKSLTTNTNTNPVTDGGTNWQLIAAYPIATAPQAQGFSNNTTLLSPLRLADALKGANQSLLANSNGYQILPGGLIIQWGVITTGTANPVLVNLPIAFPNGLLSVNFTPVQGGGSPGSILGVVFDPSNTQINIDRRVSNTAASSTVGGRWMAVGF